jgi:hypothetical protein
MSPICLSAQMARHLHLAAQGLLHNPRRTACPADVLTTIRNMALLQIDTIHVVARSPYLVLFSRLGPYSPAWLDDCLERREIYEYWAHEACFVPIEDYGLLRHRMLDPSGMGWKDPSAWLERHHHDTEALIEHIRCNGPVRAADFVRQEGKGGGWWDWKPEKRHLEALFSKGRLMVARRHNFQRVYDLTERILPGWRDERDLPSPTEARRLMLEKSCRALGITKAAWVPDYYRLKRGKDRAEVTRMADDGLLIPVSVEGWSEDAFVHRDLSDALTLAVEGKLNATSTRILSPFDPVVWDRRRALEMFGFDYRIECYTPAEKRRYGYFTLPILNRGRLIGRLDAKAHRAQGFFEIRSLHLEPGVHPGVRLGTDLRRALRELADWHGTPTLAFGRVPESLRSQLTCETA